MKSQIYFKIKNEKSYDTIRFTGGSLSLKDLKTKIKEKLQDKNQGIGKEKDKEKAKDDILVYDELTKNLIPDDSTLIAADRKVVIERSSAIPTLGPAGYRSSYPSGIKADKSEFMCNLCKNQFVNPTLTRCCGGTACETCIDKNVKLKSECPFCHKKALGSSIKAGPNVKLQEMIQKMSTSMPPAVLPMPHAYGSQPVNPNVAMNLVPFKEIDKYLNGAKYFIIKSSNFENIQLSIKHSEWATTKANETKLNNAFQRSKNVILIFSVNKSSQFQGYARMESLSTNRAASWQVQDSIKLGGSFKILWLRVCNVNFSRVSQMKNKFNNGEPIKKSRDTQEIPEDIGFQICNMFELPDKDSTAMHYPTSSDRPKYMYQYGQAPTPMGYQNPVYTAASSPRDMRDFKVLSDSVSPSEAKSPMSKPGSDDFQSNIEKEDFYPSHQEEEQKKDEPEIDLLADLDFDEPTNFEPTAPVAQIEVEDDLPLEHAVANIEEILEMAEGEVSVLDEQEIEPAAEQQHDIIEEKVVAQSETKESIPQEQEHDHDQDDFLHNFEPEDEEEDFNEKAKEESRSRSRESEQKQQFIEEEDDYRGGGHHEEEERPQPPPPKAQYEEQRRASPTRSPSAEKQEEKKKPKPPAVDMHKFPPAPSMPYDAASMMRPDSYMARPPPMVDHRPPPPNMMYPSAPQSMRYPYNNYPSAYPNQQYGSYPMAPYPGMDQRMQMGMNPNYPYQYYNYPGMWGGQGGRPFPMDSRGKLDGNDGDNDNQSERSEESEGSRKREKKKHKKEKKKKRSKDRERERSRDKSREREKSNVREKGRSRDRSRNKSKSKSRRK